MNVDTILQAFTDARRLLRARPFGNLVAVLVLAAAAAAPLRRALRVEPTEALRED